MITQTKVDRELRNRGDAGLKSKEIRNAMLGQALSLDYYFIIRWNFCARSFTTPFRWETSSLIKKIFKVHLKK